VELDSLRVAMEDHWAGHTIPSGRTPLRRVVKRDQDGEMPRRM